MLQKHGLSKMKKGLSMPDLKQAEAAVENAATQRAGLHEGVEVSEEVARPGVSILRRSQGRQHSPTPPIRSLSHRASSPLHAEARRGSWSQPYPVVHFGANIPCPALRKLH